MVKREASPPAQGNDVYIITYDEEGNEKRLLPAEVGDDVVDRSRDLGINKGIWRIERIKHGPLVAPEAQLRTVNVGSLGRAIADDYYGTLLIVDRSEPPIDEDLLDIDGRYDIDMKDGAVVAVVTQRYPAPPKQTPQEIAATLSRVATAYGCRIADVSLALPGGDTPEERLALWSGDGWPESFRAEGMKSLMATAHDVKVSVATDETSLMSTLMDGAAAVADFLRATQGGQLDAVGVLNLLRGEHFNVLLGEKESDYLEVKTAMHPIWVAGTPGEKAKIELAQDIARFANGNVNALLVVGYRETNGVGSEIGSLTPVADSLLDTTRIHEVLDARIVPPIDGLLVEKFPTSQSESVLAIYVPKQPSEMQPYLVHGAIAEGKVEGAFFSIVRRRGEGSITTSAQQIHAYIVAGKRYLSGAE